MKILLISANTFPASPTGPAYIAGAALKAGHSVRILDCFPDRPMQSELNSVLRDFDPQIVAISIRVVRGTVRSLLDPLVMEPFDIRPKVKEIVSQIKQMSTAHIILGGSGFNYYGPQWLNYLNLDYGIRGEADFSFLEYLRRLELGEDITAIPGCVFRKEDSIESVPRPLPDNLDDTACPAYHLFDADAYVEKDIALGILTKRGCAYHCSHCPYSSLEGSRYRVKSASRVVDEIITLKSNNRFKTIDFCDNNFNAPRKHAEAICMEMIRRGVDISWTGQFRPSGFSDEFCNLLKESGCVLPNVTVETASGKMLKNMRRGTRLDEIDHALICLNKAGIPFTYTLLLGGPGETPETISETLSHMESLPEPAFHWITIGIQLWTEHQNVVEIARRDGQLSRDIDLFDVPCYLSPELPKDYMLNLVESIGKRKNCYYCLFKI